MSQLPRQWSQVVRLANSLFHVPHVVRQQRLPPGVVASVSPTIVRVGDPFHHLRITRDGGVLLDGHVPTTPDQRQQARGLLSALLEGVEQRRSAPDASRVVRFATQQYGGIRHLTTRQLRSLRSSHRAFSGVGQRQLHTHRALLGKKWPAPMLERMPLGTQFEVARYELDRQDGAVLADAFFPLAVRRLCRLATRLLHDHPDRRFVWASVSGRDDSGFHDKFVVVSRCARTVFGSHSVPAVLCVGFWRTERPDRPLPANTSLTLVFDEGSERPVLRQVENPVSPYHFHKALEKVAGGGTMSFPTGVSIVRIAIAG